MSYPKISIVTASYNQGRFLEKTILSVLSQNYPNLEYIVIDGGSSDGSVEIIKKYSGRLSYWCSEADKGQYDAITKGFRKSTGDIMAFLNADDVYLPWTLATIASIFTSTQAQWVTSLRPVVMNSDGSIIASGEIVPISKKAFLHGFYIPGGKFSFGCIVQEGTFWRRSLWEKTGQVIGDKFDLAGDFDLWCRFIVYSDPYCLGHPLAAMARHQEQRSNNIERYISECKLSLNNLRVRLNHRPTKGEWLPKVVASVRKNRFLWALMRRILRYEARVINPVLNTETYHFSWNTSDLTIY